jgi:hypothetical protein
MTYTTRREFLGALAFASIQGILTALAELVFISTPIKCLCRWRVLGSADCTGQSNHASLFRNNASTAGDPAPMTS